MRCTYTSAVMILLLSGASLAGGAAPAAQRLFASGFEDGVQLQLPDPCWDTGCWQDIVGVDAVTRFRWPPRLNGGTAHLLLLTNPVPITPASVDLYAFNRIDLVTGPHGRPTRALYQEVTQNVNGFGPMGTAVAQNELQFLPKSDVAEMHVSYWMKLQPDLLARMRKLPPVAGVRNGGTWRGIFAFKTGGQRPDGEPADDGDYRLEVYVMTNRGDTPYWAVIADSIAGNHLPVVEYWKQENHSVAVPIGEWFHVAVYWRRSDGADGLVRVSIDGQTIAERAGPNFGAQRQPVNRIIAPLLYTGGSMPAYQWVDDLEIWSGPPPR